MKNALISLIALGGVIVLVLLIGSNGFGSSMNDLNPKLQMNEMKKSEGYVDNHELEPKDQEEVKEPLSEPEPRTIDPQTENPVEAPNDNQKPDTTVPEQKPITETPKSEPETEKPSTPNPTPTPTPTPDPIPETPSVDNSEYLSQVEQLIFQAVNAERSKAGVSTLSYNNTMEKYARMKSKDMATNNYFAHEDQRGQLITEQMRADGVSYQAWGENIAYIGGVNDAQTLATQFMSNWMNSQGHKDNILSTNFTGIGIGVYQSGSKVYATQEFYR